jgi:EF hand
MKRRMGGNNFSSGPLFKTRGHFLYYRSVTKRGQGDLNMKAQLLLIASALLLMSNIAGAHEQKAPSAGAQDLEAPSAKMTGEDTMGHHGMMRHRMMRQRMHMRVFMALIDTDGDGALSLEEVQAAHAKIFKVLDADKDGKVTFEEMQLFFRGGSPTSAQ